MALTRRRLFATLACGSLGSLLVGTDSVTRVGISQAVDVDTTGDGPYLWLNGATLQDPVAEPEATMTIGPQINSLTVITLDADEFRFDPTPPIPLSEPVSVDVSLTGAQTATVTDTVRIGFEGPDVQSVIERTLQVKPPTEPRS